MDYGQQLDGRKIREIRRQRNLSQQELAAAADTTQVTVSNIERDMRRVQYATTRRLANALGVEPRELLRQ